MSRVVTAGILLRRSEILVLRRAPGENLAGKWEFPGGKLEPGETEAQCLERELREELGIRGQTGNFFAESLYSYPRGTILLRAYFFSCSTDRFELRVHDAAQWTAPSALLQLDLAPADRPIAARLKEVLS